MKMLRRPHLRRVVSKNGMTRTISVTPGGATKVKKYGVKRRSK